MSAATWAPDVGGKQDYDGSLVAFSTRYYPPHKQGRNAPKPHKDDALALIVGRLNHSAMSDGMWEDSRDALMVLGYTREQIQAAMERYGSL